MSREFRAHPWFWGVSLGLGLGVVVVVSVLLYANDRTPSDPPVLVTNEPSMVVPSSVPSTIKKVVASQEPPQLPILDFPPGSVEEACGLNDFPPRVGYYSYEADERSSWLNYPFNAKGDLIALESEECWTALENHLSTINPYLWGAAAFKGKLRWGPTSFKGTLLNLIELDNPLTFGRIFANPAGDLAQVQDALSRPECLLEPTESNWELKESCHADAFLNYALFSRYCYDDGVRQRRRTYFWEEDNPTPAQDRFMWKQVLEDAWVEAKCEEFNTVPEFTEYNPELTDLIFSLNDPEKKKVFAQALIRYAARLGDEAAGLTESSMPSYQVLYNEQGFKYGRIAELLGNEWGQLYLKETPSTERFLQTFKLLARLTSRKPDPRDEFELNWEWVARYLCEPPYYTSSLNGFVQVENVEHPSCQEIVHEIRQSGTTFRPLIDVLDKFEQVALELEVYE